MIEMIDHKECALNDLAAAAIAAGKMKPSEILVTSAETHATLALVEVTERLAVAQETANDLAFNARITSLPDGIRNAIDPAVIERAVRAGQRAMKAMGL